MDHYMSKFKVDNQHYVVSQISLCPHRQF